MNRTQGRRASRVVVAVALAVGLVGLTACNGGIQSGESSPENASPSASVAQASSSPTSELSTEPTPEPTSTVYVAATPERAAQNVPVPVMPEEAKLQTKEGWEAFAKYYIEELNYMAQTNDVTRLQKITTRGCEYCGVQQGLAKFRQENNQWLTGGEYSLEYVMTQMDPTETGTIAGLLAMSRAESTPHERRGTLPSTAAIESSNWSMTLYWYEGAWAVDRLRVIEK